MQSYNYKNIQVILPRSTVEDKTSHNPHPEEYPSHNLEIPP